MTRRGMLVAALAALLPGCVALDKFTEPADGPPPPTSKVCQLATTWHKEVVYPADPLHGGQPHPALTGRLYLFGTQSGAPVVGDGTLVVDLYSVTRPPPPAGAQPAGAATSAAPEVKKLEQWRLDQDTLKQLLRRDPIGWGYTLILPWSTFKPEIEQVMLRIGYQPAHGTPVFSESQVNLIRNR